MRPAVLRRRRPASRGDAERIELKNLAGEASRQLQEIGADRGDVAAIDEELAELVGDDEFWRYQARSLALFLTPQFGAGGKIVSGATYAKLYMAAYTGIKAGNPRALVAAGETSNRGHNRPTGGVSDSTAPATFARAVAVANPRLPFAAWSTMYAI